MSEYDKPLFSAGAVNGDMKDSKEIGTKKNAVRALALALLMVGMAQVGYTGGDQLDPLDAERADYTGTITSMVEGAELQLSEAMTPITLNYTSQAGGASFYNGNGSSWLVKDINSGKNSGTQEFTTVVAGDYLFFRADDGTNGTELWRSDGTEAGTGMVKDINTGATWDSSSDPYHLTAMGGNIYFAADNGSQSQELWRSDGTESGTVMLMSFIDLGAQSYAFTDPFAIVGDAFYFNANDGTHGRELWKSDGTEAGTVMVKDIRPDYAGNNILDYAVMGDNLYFQASDNIHGTELWKTDGTEAGTVMVKDINTECTSTSCTQTYGSSPQYLTADGETLYFRADDGTHGKELWRSDGTESGTVLVKDIVPGSGGSGGSSNSFTVVGDTIFFDADDGTHGTELWRSDGTESGTVMVKDIRPDGASSYPLYLTAIGDLVFFRAQGSDENGNDWGIWRSDGTEAGTIALTSSPYAPNGLKAIGDTLFFSLKDTNANGTEMWRSDGTVAGTEMIDVTPDPYRSSNSFGFTLLGSTVYFSADNDLGNAPGATGFELHAHDPTNITLDAPPPASWRAEPALPAGISISGGTISGTPSV